MAELDKKKIYRNLVRARSHLILSEPFYGQLVHKLQLVQDPPESMWQGLEPTIATDGKVLIFNSEFIAAQDHDKLVGLNCHEVMHPALGHPWRRGGRNPKGWNLACDFAIDPMIQSSGKVLPEGAHIHEPWIGKSAEWIYDQLPRRGHGDKPNDEQGDDEGDFPGKELYKPGKGGHVLDDLSGDQAQVQVDWQLSVLQAAQMARGQGKLPAGVERLVHDITHPKIDWHAALRRWFARQSNNDYSMRRPNRRFVPQGLYLPSMMSESMGSMGLLWDTSGSRDYPEAYAECAAEVKEIIYEVKPERLHVFYVDTEIQRIEVFEQGDPIEFHPVGGGGTDFTSCFEHIEREELDLACLVGITDLEARFPDKEPRYPVIWCATEDRPAPFGEVLLIND